MTPIDAQVKPRNEALVFELLTFPAGTSLPETSVTFRR
jgi:hypothetical protein